MEQEADQDEQEGDAGLPHRLQLQGLRQDSWGAGPSGCFMLSLGGITRYCTWSVVRPPEV